MKISKTSHVSSAKTEANRWSAKDDFTLAMLAGSHTYEEIALSLGRSPEAVQRRASRKGLKVRESSSADAKVKESRKRVAELNRLKAEEEDLSEFLVECDEPPALPLPGSREYQREYKRNQRAKDKS